MSRTVAVWLSTCMVVAPSLAAQGLVPASPGSVGLSAERLERIGEAMERYIQEGLFPGMTVSIARKGRLAWSRSFGFADLETRRPGKDDDIFAIYSMSKPVTAVAALILWEEGRYRLDEPVAKYLPEFADVKVYSEEGDSTSAEPPRPMTIRDLFRHTSGLGYGWGQGPVDKIYQELNIWDPSLTLDEAVKRLARAPLYFAPGTRWHYSTSIDVLGRLVEVLSGETLDVFLERRIFRPLGMSDTGFYVAADKAHRLTGQYRYDDQEKKLVAIPRDDLLRRYGREHNRLLSGGGGLLSTAADYLRFAQMLANGGILDGVRILSRKTVELMHADHLPPGVTLPWDKLQGHGHGLGVTVLKDLAASTGTGSIGDFGWDGAASTWFRIDPEEALVIVLMTHRMPCDTDIQVKLKTLVYQALAD
jgi:CubicO group peptidase (beta-lactamase class C family)